MGGLLLACAIWLALLPLCCGLFASTGHAAEAISGADLVRVETGPPCDITGQPGEERANLLDDGSTRVMPVTGHGGVQNLADLPGARGIDMVFLQLDVLDYVPAQHLFPALQSRINHVTKLNYVEFHLLAGPEVTDINNLAGKHVDVGPALGDTAITVDRLFRLLHISIVPANDAPALAITRPRRSAAWPARSSPGSRAC